MRIGRAVPTPPSPKLNRRQRHLSVERCSAVSAPMPPFTAPALTVLMASRQSEAGGFSRNSAHNTGGNSFGGGGGGPGGGGGAADAASPAEAGASAGSAWAGAQPRPFFCVRIGGARPRLLSGVTRAADHLDAGGRRRPGRCSDHRSGGGRGRAARAILEGLRDGQGELAIAAMLHPRLRGRALRRSPAGSRFASGLVAPGRGAQAQHQPAPPKPAQSGPLRRSIRGRCCRRSGSDYGHPGWPCWSVR